VSQRTNLSHRVSYSCEKSGRTPCPSSYVCAHIRWDGWDGWTRAGFVLYRCPNLACSVPTSVGPIRVYTYNPMSDPVRCSELVETLEQATELYAKDLAGSRKITCHGQPVTIVFDSDGTHLYSVSYNGADELELHERVVRRIPAGKGRFRMEVRHFDLKRACLMSYILPAISNFTVSVPEAGGRPGLQKRVLYGPELPHSDERILVVVRPGPGDAWTCVSAYPVSRDQWLKACKLKRAKFPP